MSHKLLSGVQALSKYRTADSCDIMSKPDKSEVYNEAKSLMTSSDLNIHLLENNVTYSGSFVALI